LPLPQGHPPVAIVSGERLRKILLEKRGARGFSPWAASPTGEERGHTHSCLVNNQISRKMDFDKYKIELFFKLDAETFIVLFFSRKYRTILIVQI
jgi:hypothetical protein